MTTTSLRRGLCGRGVHTVCTSAVQKLTGIYHFLPSRNGSTSWNDTLIYNCSAFLWGRYDVRVQVCTRGGQSTASKNQFSPMFMRVWGDTLVVKLVLSLVEPDP